MLCVGLPVLAAAPALGLSPPALALGLPPAQRLLLAQRPPSGPRLKLARTDEPDPPLPARHPPSDAAAADRPRAPPYSGDGEAGAGPAELGELDRQQAQPRHDEVCRATRSRAGSWLSAARGAGGGAGV